MASGLPAEFLAHLRDLLGDDGVVTGAGGRLAYGYDNSRLRHAPDAVVRPDGHDQVREVVRLCHRFELPLISRGAGTNTAGATVPAAGGIVLSSERMTRMEPVDADNRVLVVEPGVTNQQVQEAAGAAGFFWPPDPTSSAVCTVGGNIACNAAGPRAVKYGTTREAVLGLRAVTGDGRELRTGVYTSKGVVGYDLTRLLIGAEGTLAVITEATLRLQPRPAAKRTLRGLYRDAEDAARAVAAVMAQPVTPCALEFMDGEALRLAREHAGADVPAEAGALLMIEVDGAADCVDSAAREVERAASTPTCLGVDTARDEAEVARLWAVRKALSPALRHVAPKKINEDVVVPVSRIPELIGGLETLARRHGIAIVNFGHAGNGNVHVNLLVDPDAPGQNDAAEHCLGDVFDLVLRLDGTLSGEHGIGSVKREFVGRELGAVALDLMHRIKDQFDPAGILNPGKKLPDPD